MTNKRIGKLFKEYREKAGLTQVEAAVKLGYQTRQHISNIERGESVSLPLAVKLSKIYHVPRSVVIQALTKDFMDHLNYHFRKAA